METLVPDQGMYNDLVFKLAPGIDYENVKDQLEDALKPYGLISIIPRADQTSHLLLSEELKSLEAMSTSLPIIFLAIAAMILYITLKRLIEQQRGQIGILKAFGYSTQEILTHYLSYSLVIALVGSILGGILGIVSSYPHSFTKCFLICPVSMVSFPFYLLAGIIFQCYFLYLLGIRM